MSLFDTIKAAGDEAKENRDAVRKPTEEQDEEESGGLTKKSLSRAKPTREAAAGVRVVTSTGKPKKGYEKPRSEMTTEEKREERRRVRDDEDRRSLVVNALLDTDDEYKKKHHRAMMLVVWGLVFTGLSWVIVLVFPDTQYDASTVMGMLAIVTLVIAYIGVLGGFIYDWVGTHKIRDRYTDRVRGMTDNQLQAVIAQDAKRAAQKPRWRNRFRRKPKQAETTSQEQASDAK